MFLWVVLAVLLRLCALLWVYFRYPSPLRRIGRGVWFRSWNGECEGSASLLEEPSSEEQLVQVVRDAAASGKVVRCVGGGHSWNRGFASTDVLVSLDKYKRVLAIDRAAGTVTVQAGIRLHELNAHLDREGLAMPVLGSISEQSAGGAISTATHGTGVTLPNLSGCVEKIKIVRSVAPHVVVASQNQDAELFHAACVSMGALGIVAEVTFRVRPAFNLRCVQEPMEVPKLLQSLGTRLKQHTAVKFWFDAVAGRALVYHLDETEAEVTPGERFRWWRAHIEYRLFDLLLAAVSKALPFHWQPPAVALITKGAFQKKTYVGGSHEVWNVPGGVPIRHPELEYAVPVEQTGRVLEQLIALARENKHHDINFVHEVRFVKGDDLWLSPAYGRDTVQFTMCCYGRPADNRWFNEVEKIFLSIKDARPHWGKAFTARAHQLESRYPKWQQFQEVRSKMDPSATFTSPYIREVLGPVQKL